MQWISSVAKKVTGNSKDQAEVHAESNMNKINSDNTDNLVGNNKINSESDKDNNIKMKQGNL